MKNQEKIIELGVEGGSISIYKFLDKKGDDWYYHHTQEMSWEDLGINGTDKKSNHISMSFPEAIFEMLGKYENAMTFYPVYINLEFKTVIIELLKQSRKEIEMNKERWFELLKIDERELDIDIIENYDK